MRKKSLAILTAAIAIEALAGIRITSPKSDECVELLWPAQKYFYDLSREQRQKFIGMKDKDPMWMELKKVGGKAKPVVISWTGAAEGETWVRVRRMPDKKVFFETMTTNSSVSIDGRLEIAREWQVQVKDAKGEKAAAKFTTEDRAPRIITLQGTGNMRDIGGRIGWQGRRIKQGLVFRNAGLNQNAKTEYYTYEEIHQLHKEGKLATAGTWKSRNLGASYEKLIASGKDVDKKHLRLFKSGPTAPGKERLTKDDLDYLLNELKIKTDIDFRSDWECYGMTGSPLGDSVTWVHQEYIAGYGKIGSPLGRACSALYFSQFIDKKNYPIDFHCIGGADRTGTWAYLFNAFLGVDEEELIKDYETTFISGCGVDERHYGWLTDMVKAVMALPGDTLADKMRTYFISMGFTPEEVDGVREFMLEPKKD